MNKKGETMKDQSLSKPITWTVIILAAFILIFGFLTNWRWPVSVTKSMDFKFVDEKTGEPIPGVLLEINWLKRVYGFEAASIIYRTDYRLSNNEGRIHVPTQIHWHILSHFDDIHLEYSHPLYPSNKFFAFQKDVENKYGLIINSVDFEIRDKEILMKPTSVIDIYKGTRCSDDTKTGCGLSWHINRTIEYFKIIGDLFKKDPNTNAAGITKELNTLILSVYPASNYRSSILNDLSGLENGNKNK